MIDSVEGVVNSKGILEDGLHFFTEVCLFLPAHGAEAFAFIQDLAFGWLQKAQCHHAQGGLATTAFAGHGNNTGRIVVDKKGNIIERHHAGFIDFGGIFEFE